MPKFSHIGRDNTTRSKFRIVHINQAEGTIDLLFKQDGWDSTAKNEVQMPWTDFVEGIIEGRYELSPTKHSKI